MRILIVDDDIATVDAILCTIDWEALGVEAVDTAYSAAQARRILQNGQIDLMVSDIEMPQGSGLELLSWVRERELPVECLLLTCHERFDYAASAVKLSAVDYLTKPFDAGIMTLSLKRAIARVRENKRLLEGSRYGEWRSQNPRHEELSFWRSLLSEAAERDEHQLGSELEARALPFTAQARFRLVTACVSEYDRPMHELGRELLFYILENAFSRCLCGQEENRRVVRHLGSSGLWLFIAADDQPDSELLARCQSAISACADTARVRVTCCVGDAAPLPMLGSGLAAMQALVERSVAYYGQAFLESEQVAGDGETSVLDAGRLSAMLTSRDKVAVLNAIKQALGVRAAMRTLSERTLYLMKQELMQAVYAYLAQAGVQAATLFQDEASIRLSELACRSAVDTLRFANYLLEHAFAREDEHLRSSALTEKIDTYLRKHYREDIGRAELAAEFHLAGEYLAKLYKKKTGKTFKDTLREYRMEQAKRLLRDPDVLISDVAAEAGYDNFSYFSTLFKKETGLTPQEYRRG